MVPSPSLFSLSCAPSRVVSEQVNVYKGDKRSSKDDTLIGGFAIPLKPLLDGAEVRFSPTQQPPSISRIGRVLSTH